MSGNPSDGESTRMEWFYTRDQDFLGLETRCRHHPKEYVGILSYADGRREEHRFSTLPAFRAWLVAFDARLEAERWAQTGAPYVLPEGWPEQSPLQ